MLSKPPRSNYGINKIVDYHLYAFYCIGSVSKASGGLITIL